MQCNFSTVGKAARDAIAVPDLNLSAIRLRAHEGSVRERLRKFSVATLAALGIAGAGVVGARVYEGMHLWLSGDRMAVQFQSFAYVIAPTPAELRDIVGRATFPVTLPAGLPVGTRVSAISYTPEDRPSSIIVNYQGRDPRFKPTIVLVDPTSLNAAPLPGPADRSKLGAVYTWNVNGETVLVPRRVLPADGSDKLKGAMSRETPQSSLAATEPMLAPMIVLGYRLRLEEAERYRPSTGRSVLLDEVQVAVAMRHVAFPVLDARTSVVENIHYVNGQPKWSQSGQRVPQRIAVQVNGVRAIAAVMSHAHLNTNACACNVLINQAGDQTYRIWVIPFSGGLVTRYAVDARTLAVTAST